MVGWFGWPCYLFRGLKFGSRAVEVAGGAEVEEFAGGRASKLCDVLGVPIAFVVFVGAGQLAGDGGARRVTLGRSRRERACACNGSPVGKFEVEGDFGSCGFSIDFDEFGGVGFSCGLHQAGDCAFIVLLKRKFSFEGHTAVGSASDIDVEIVLARLK